MKQVRFEPIPGYCEERCTLLIVCDAYEAPRVYPPRTGPWQRLVSPIRSANGGT